MKIAVIGSGIAGNACAWALSHTADVTLYEKRNRPGGHSATEIVDYDGTDIAVDTGFIVYNAQNYPNLIALFDTLGVPTKESDMSFGVSLNDGAFEWSGQSLQTIFAQKRHVVSIRFMRMLNDIMRFNREASADRFARMTAERTLGEYVREKGYSESFIKGYLIPMGAAIWSTPAARILDFPADSFITFFENHNLLTRTGPPWRTVDGGSRVYVEKLLAPLKDRVRLGTRVVEVTRGDRITVKDSAGHTDTFDHVVFASHTDQTLEMLADASPAERSLLSAIEYRPNEVYLHRDESLMPKRKKVWSSWNYQSFRTQDGTNAAVSYWMNKLQSIPAKYPLFVSLNPRREPDPATVFGRYTYDHPQFDNGAIDAQNHLNTIQGVRNTWFCGAWTKYGFHEDGLRSGLDVAEALGAEIPWRPREDQPASSMPVA